MHQRRWQKLKLIWITAPKLTITIDYGLLWLYIFIQGRFSLFYINFLTGFMICSISCSTCSKSTKAWNQMGTSVRNGQQFFILFGRKYYFILKLKFSYYNNIFGKVFHFKSNRPNNATVCETPMLKKYFNSWRKYFPVWHFIGNHVFTISALFPCFSVFSLFKLMQLVCLAM